MLDILPKMEVASIHCCVTDPPYELGMMGAKWDKTGIAFRPETWAAVLRVMRPGAFMVAFASTRGYHRMVCAIEDAGFLIHPMLGWITSQGFPKASSFDQPELDGWRYGLQALKPSIEPICMAQRPMEKRLTGSQNWAKHGCGGLNIDGCRVDAGGDALGGGAQKRVAIEGKGEGWARPWMHDPDAVAAHAERVNANVEKAESLGRWPPNLAHDGSPEVLEAFAAFGTSTSSDSPRNNKQGNTENWRMARQDHTTFGHSDTGTAARFFYSAKADAADRADSKHPTVKPVDVIRWLCTLICPPGGTILDPFAGSGTTGEAAMLCGFDCTLIEREAAHVADIEHRIKRWQGLDMPLFADVAD